MGPPSSLSLRRVLIVDDNEDAAVLLCELVACLGHESRYAFDGPAGIAIAADFIPDVIFLDIGMPGMSGFDVAIALRKNPVLAGSRIVALTGWKDEATCKRALDSGFDFHIAKPATLDLIQTLV